MRIPNSVINHQVTSLLTQTSGKLTRLQMDIASGVRIQRPSDDPINAMRSANFQSGLDRITQFQRSIKEGKAWLRAEESALGNIQNLLRDARTYALQGANPLPAEGREALAAQIEAVRDNLINEGNAVVGSRFIFGGFQTTDSPFSMNAGVYDYAGDTGAINISLSDATSFKLNTDGAELFNMDGTADPAEADIFTTLTLMATAVRAGDNTAVNTEIANIDQHITRISSIRAATGIKMQQLDLAANQLDQSASVLTSLLSDAQDTDITEAVVKLKEQQNALQAVSYLASSLSDGGLLNWLQ